MPIRRTEESTGIYRTVTERLEWERGPELTVKLGPTQRDIRDLKKLFPAEEFDIYVHLDRFERGAKRIIKTNGGFPGLRRTKDGGEWFPLPEDASPIARRARELIFEVWSARDGMKELEAANPALVPQLEELAFELLRLGWRAQIVAVSPRENDARSGAKSRAGGKKGRQTQDWDGSFKRKYRNQWPNYQPAFDEVLKQRPNWSKTAIAKQIAARYSVCDRTVLRHIKDPREK
jgi:hypothetical protein